MNPLANYPFLKMNGIGNEIVVLDLRGTQITVRPEEARAIAAAPTSHFDQLMVLFDPRTEGTNAYMQIFNTDGSMSAACGNGTRCVAWALLNGTEHTALILETDAGLLPCRRDGELSFTVDMGTPRFKWDEIPLSREFSDSTGIDLTVGPVNDPLLHSPVVVNMGNPHAIFFVSDLDVVDLSVIGPELEYNPLFPERANISLAHVTARDAMTLKVWERGAGLTQACGSAACAAAVAGSRRGLTGRTVRVSLPGGDLLIQWEKDGHVLMTGAVELEHEGTFDPSIFGDAA